MKQLAQYQDGRLEIQDVPAPTAPPGGVLVRTTHSVISIGTEKMKVQQAKMNLAQKAMARPDQVRKVLDTARTLGWRAAWEKVQNRLETPTPLGYSAAGVVVAVDAANTRFRVGDRVACAGAECAFHAEFLALPDFLIAPVPAKVENWRAAYTTLASIALQAVRQAEVGVGDRVMVIGQGLIGLLVTNLLAAAGVRVMALELDAARKNFSESMGAERFIVPSEQIVAEEVRAWTEGFGVDAAILCTATASNVPVEQAAEALRDRGRVVVVGNTHAELDWKIFYEKELEVRYSRSYGPGRYDASYEWGGADYPVGYVRWTEQRNFQACLHLMAEGRLNLRALTTRVVPFAETLQVYEELLTETARDVGVVLEYAGDGPAAVKEKSATVESSNVSNRHSQPTTLAQPVSRLDVIGAGNFARTMLLPHLHGQIEFGTVINQTGLSANHTKTKFDFADAATDATAVLAKSQDDPRAILIATRHHLHAPLVKAALAADRHVFVEKPLCLTRAELAEIDAAFSASKGSVMVGFNRRFAPASVELKQLLENSPGPKSASYRVNAGPLDPQHWYANPAESGGRVLGEACHFLDYFCWLLGSAPVRVFAQTTWPAGGRLPFPDSVTAQVEFADGSCGQLVYSAEGDTSHAKETLTVFASGLVAELVDFQKLRWNRERTRNTETFDSKGHAEEMVAWLAFLRGVAPHPLPYAEARTSMLLTFAVLDSIRNARSESVG